MSAVQKAIQDVKYRIPMELLRQAFVVRGLEAVIGPQGMRMTPVSIDYLIRQAVVEPRVIVDTDLIGGQEVDIYLHNLCANMVNPYTSIYTIPKSMTQGRVISRAVSIQYGIGSIVGPNNMALGANGSSPMMDAVSGVFASAMPIPITSTAYVRLIGENTVLVNDNTVMPGSAILRCVLESDTDFSHLPKTAWHAFGQLVEYAVKAYIYNLLVIEVGMAQLVGGQELGRFKDILDSYSDANDNYTTYLDEKWRVINLLSDPQQMQRHLSLITGGCY